MDRRTAILEGAAALFLEKGFHGVGMDELGKRVGVSGPAIYHHFAGKDEILATLFDDAMDKVVAPEDDARDDPREEVERLVRHHAEFVVAHRALVAVYAHEHRSLAEPWRRRFARRVGAHRARWEEAVALLHPRASDIDVATAVQCAFGLLNSVVLWPPKVLDEPGVVDRLCAQALGGLDGLD